MYSSRKHLAIYPSHLHDAGGQKAHYRVFTTQGVLAPGTKNCFGWGGGEGVAHRK